MRKAVRSMPPAPPSATPFGLPQAGLRAHEWVNLANRLPVRRQLHLQSLRPDSGA